MIDHDLVLSRLALIDGNLAHLERLRGTPQAEFLTQVEKWASARYLIQTSIEAMIDVCNHIIASQRWGSPSTHQQALALLAQHGALATSKLDDYRGMVRFRNMVVHLYHVIDDEKVFELLQTRLDDFRSFVADIHGFLARNP